jgi:Uma2 family endonuclease
MLARSQHRFTVSDYYRMAESGLFAPNDRVELLDGAILDTASVDPFHGGSVNRLARLFNKVADSRWLVSIQGPVHLNDHSEPRPDLMLLQPAREVYTSRHPLAEDVFLLIEVANSSLEMDRAEKLPAYGHAGIPEVWIVNLRDKIIEIYREPHFSGYGSRKILNASEQASPLAFPEIHVDGAALLSAAP